MALRDELLRDALPREVVELSSGHEVAVRALSTAEWIRLDQYEDDRVLAAVAVWVVLGTDGERVFSDDDVDTVLDTFTLGDLRMIGETSKRLAGFGALDEAKKD